jgi:hypothetical protein
MVDDNPNRIVDYIRPGPYRLDWDSLMTAMDIIETLDQVNPSFLKFSLIT